MEKEKEKPTATHDMFVHDFNEERVRETLINFQQNKRFHSGQI